MNSGHLYDVLPEGIMHVTRCLLRCSGTRWLASGTQCRSVPASVGRYGRNQRAIGSGPIGNGFLLVDLRALNHIPRRLRLRWSVAFTFPSRCAPTRGNLSRSTLACAGMSLAVRLSRRLFAIAGAEHFCE